VLPIVRSPGATSLARIRGLHHTHQLTQYPRKMPRKTAVTLRRRAEEVPHGPGSTG
jgi:hypothetical protein